MASFASIKKTDAALRRLSFIGLSGALAALALTGCSAVPYESGTAVRVDAAQTDGTQKKKEEPKPIPITMPSEYALRGDGIYYFNDNAVSNFRITDAIAENGLYSVEEYFRFGTPHGFTWGAGAASILRNGRQLDAEKIIGVSVEKDHHLVLHYKGETAQKPMRLNVEIEAFDMSGLPIGPYLKTRMNRSTPSGFLIGGKYAFPEGSIGYRARMWVDEDVVIVPTKTAFTGSGTIEDFSKRFSKEIPYCLRFVPAKDAKPMGVLFEKPIEKKYEKVKGKRVEKGQSGEAQLMRVKTSTIFCAKDETAEKGEALGKLDWTLRYVNGSRVLEFSFPENLKSDNFGVLKSHRDALRVAFAEERSKNRTKLLPARIWLKNKPILDFQWRFNKRAADAIQDAIHETADLRREWDAKHGTATRVKAPEKAVKAAPAKNTKSTRSNVKRAQK